MRVSRARRPAPAFIKVLVTLVALAGISFSVALLWQNAQDSVITFGAAADASPGKDPSGGSQGSTGDGGAASPSGLLAAVSQAPSPLTDQPESIDEPSSESSEADASADEPPADSAYQRGAVAGSVAASPAVDYGYFDDAIFFGDSISTGIPLYMKTSVPNAAVIAMTGVNPDSANWSECIDVNGTRVTMLEAAKTKGERKKVYIMLGANALDLDEESFMKGYRTFVQSVKELYPEAVVYVQSILPVTTAVNNVYKSPNVNNDRIDSYNAEILAMARELGVHYLDVAQCMVNADGVLPTEASPLDGMHLTPEYYVKWFDYLRTHTV